MADNVKFHDITWELVPYMGIIFKPAPNDPKVRFRIYNGMLEPDIITGYFHDIKRNSVWFTSDVIIPINKLVDILIDKGAQKGAISLRRGNDLCMTINFGT